MNKKAFYQESAITSSSIPSSKVDILSLAEQHQLICGSYCLQYGILVRLAIFSGLNLSELLGLQWANLDPDRQGLHIRYTFGTEDGGYELRNKSASRFVPLPSYLFKEL